MNFRPNPAAAILLVVCLVAAYGLSYCVFVHPPVREAMAGPHFGPLRGVYPAWGAGWMAVVYWPLERIDRQLRPTAWDFESAGWTSYPPATP